MADADLEELADRIRAMLGDEPGIEEKRMFGSRGFLLDGHILVGARKGGTLLVRVDAEQDDALLLKQGVSRATMGTMTMSSGWLDVAREAIATDDDLLFWLDLARESNSSRS